MLTLMLTLAQAGTLPRRQDVGICGLFLTSGFVRPDPRAPLPFAKGLPLALNGQDSDVLFSRTDVEDFLEDHPNSPWAVQLRDLPESAFDSGNNLVLISRVGLSVWRLADFDNWIRLQRLPMWNHAHSVQDLISDIATGMNAPGLSPQANERIRNALYAAKEAEGDRREGLLRQELFMARLDRGESNPPSEIELPPDVDYARMDPAERGRLIENLFMLEIERKAAKTAQSLRSSLPSLNLSFLPGDSSLEKNEDALWVGRLLVREALVRRLWTGGKPLRENTIYLLAAFPEFIPFWPQVDTWTYPMEHHPLRLELGFYPHEIGPVNEEGDSIYLDLRHRFIGPRNRPVETVNLRLRFAAHGALFPSHGALFPYEPEPTLHDLERLQGLLLREWRAFRVVYPSALPVFMYLHYDAVQHHAEVLPGGNAGPGELLAFFMFLAQKYPLKSLPAP